VVAPLRHRREPSVLLPAQMREIDGVELPSGGLQRHVLGSAAFSVVSAAPRLAVITARTIAGRHATRLGSVLPGDPREGSRRDAEEQIQRSPEAWKLCAS
jgi:hypothetical protein